MTQEITTSRRLAPEDIVPGMFIAIAVKTHEFFPYWLIGCVPGVNPELVRVTCLACAEGLPRRVMSVCLPENPDSNFLSHSKPALHRD